MYKLEKVYASISFEYKRVKLLVLEHKDNNKFNCLYYDYFDMEYLDSNFMIINQEELIKNLLKLIHNSDQFLLNKISRYIVNVSCLPLKMKENCSMSFDVLKPLTSQNEEFYLNKVKNVSDNQEYYLMDLYPTKWLINDLKFDAFPENIIAPKISFEYVSIFSSQKLITQFENILSSIGVEIMKITNDCISLGNISIAHKKPTLVVEIKNTRSIVNYYDEKGNLGAVKYIDFGANVYIDKIKELCSIATNVDVISLINNLNSLEKIGTNLPVIHAHSAKFLKTKIITYQGLKDKIKKVNDQLFSELEGVIKSICETYAITFNEIYINTCDNLTKPFSLIPPPNLYGCEKIINLGNDIIGLEDDNVNELLSSILYVIYISGNKKNYSMDPFVAQTVQESQMWQSIFTKIGVISTRYAAKLGE